MHLYKKKNRPLLRLMGLAGICMGAAVLLWLVSGRLERTAKEEQTELLREALNQAVVSCYAIEGRYPQSLDYLIENYGIRIDEERYAVTYEIFAENIRPGIRVVRLGEGK